MAAPVAARGLAIHPRLRVRLPLRRVFPILRYDSHDTHKEVPNGRFRSHTHQARRPPLRGAAAPEDATRAILNAGRQAQSSKNSQPWQFIAISDRATLKQLAECGTYAGHLAGAALGVALVAPETDPEMRPWIMFDIGQAAAHMQLAAWELGIGSCIATIYEPEKAREVPRHPRGSPARCRALVRLPAADVQLDRPPRPGGRRSYDEVVHQNRW